VRTLSKSATCPICDLPGMLTLRENVDPVRGTDGHEIEFSCGGIHPPLSEVELLKLWATDHSSA
jgi:hypothetical protein